MVCEVDPNIGTRNLSRPTGPEISIDPCKSRAMHVPPMARPTWSTKCVDLPCRCGITQIKIVSIKEKKKYEGKKGKKKKKRKKERGDEREILQGL